MSMKFAFTGFVAILSLYVRSETAYLECEAFEAYGGWKNDTQFMDQMGSPYLIAHGLGRPVADATTSFQACRGGTYDVWVRTKNWTAPWYGGNDGAGVFRLVVNGRMLPQRLGCQGRGEWLWTKAGVVDLPSGLNTVSLHDMDGFDGRCDAVVFTTDGEPPFERPRECSGVRTISSDLCVVGGGIAGICTAVSAARLGMSVVLVNDRPVLGGSNSSEIRVHLGAWQNVKPYPRLGDVLAEFAPKRGGNAESAANYEDGRKLAVVQAEKNIRLCLEEHVNAVSTDASNRILQVTSANTRMGRKTVYAARWFADCTGDGTVGCLAGADYRMGREARGETGEPWAPEHPDGLTMGASVQWRAHETLQPRVFPFCPWMIRLDDANGLAQMKGDWDWETGMGRDQIAEAEYIRDYGLLVAFSNWAYAKNFSAKSDVFRKCELEWVAYVAGRRESRRLLGDFILSERHILERDYQPDGTATATWTIDLHYPKTREQSGFDGEPFRSNSENKRIWPYPIPYRCLYSRNVPNLFMAGRDISVTHVALGTTRLMRTHGMLGEVVGMAAAVCKRNACDPRDVYVNHWQELRALMSEGVGDGKNHSPQDYNRQRSLDPELSHGGTAGQRVAEEEKVR